MEGIIFRKATTKVTHFEYLKVYEEMKKPESERGIISLRANNLSFDILPTFIRYNNGVLYVEGRDTNNKFPLAI